MRVLLHLLTLVALLVAPLAAPAAAMAPVRSASADCEGMDMGPAGHPMPAGHHRAGEACCIAVPAAIDPPPTAFCPARPLDHPMFVALTVVFPFGVDPQAEDPPPRSA